jgi:hypothetical protein
MEAETYRRLQMDAVTGHSGSSESEILLITSSVQVEDYAIVMDFDPT